MSAQRAIRAAAFGAVILVGAVNAAIAEAPAHSPRPAIRPSMAGIVQVVKAAARPVRGFAITASPRPTERPEKLQQVSSERRRATVASSSKSARGAICGDPDIIGKMIQPIPAKLDGCGLPEGVAVISVAGVALTTPASIDCKTAKALKSWVVNGVKPAVGRKGGGVRALRIAASYSCRTRNNVKGAKISEHGRGRALDISAILLGDGSAVTIEKGWGSRRYGKALKSMRSAACGPFKTVLGPGSDRYHSDHFHFDTARRKSTYCR